MISNLGTAVRELLLTFTLASTQGRIFAFTSDLAKIRPGIDCMLENMPPSLINRAHEVSLAFRLIRLFQTCLIFQRQRSSLVTKVKNLLG